MKKFVIIQCVKAYHAELANIFESIQIDAYSEMDVEGFMKQTDGKINLSNWFGSNRKPYDYMVSFAFLEEEKADELLNRIDQFNQSIEGISPINAYIVGIEKFV